MINSVSSNRLHRRAVQCCGHRMREATVFPFFERSGKVRRVVVANWDDGEIYALEATPKVPLLGRICVPSNGKLLAPVRREEVRELAQLWHFDPWWILDEPRFAGLRGRDELKRTNCVGQSSSKLATTYYRRDLSRVVWVAYDDGAGGLDVGRWDAKLVPEKERPPAAEGAAVAERSTGWILDPDWNRGR